MASADRKSSTTGGFETRPWVGMGSLAGFPFFVYNFCICMPGHRQKKSGTCAARARSGEVVMAEVLDIIELIKKLALIEAEGVGFYRSLAEHAGDENIKKLARMMARAEENHRQGFIEVAEKLERRRKTARPSKVTGDLRQYIIELIDHRIFLSPEQAATLARNVANLDEAVDMAIKFEKENILLLQECREIAAGTTRKIIDKIIQQERKHVIGLRKARVQLLARTASSEQ
ncbi:MAG: hypothetical protein C4520_19885 [Candidatus Abyssobacteria bacterium SURF_5]|uniref:Rubrerythrin diiron-binding domain-containing protein n=1 Tax=Abyssobacteria bacterium (strain SURF_5) TaxID=2093360 RepID=A0A3A4NBE3_ABYX5|nr:MAG: hypothetical protein C4520_19885 [Candidatus Abyssubacteria bacterium SURF_5]